MFLLKFIKTTTLKGRHNKPSCSEFLTFCNKCKLKEKTGKSHSKRTFSAAKGDRVQNYWTLKSFGYGGEALQILASQKEQILCQPPSPRFLV